MGEGKGGSGTLTARGAWERGREGPGFLPSAEFGRVEGRVRGSSVRGVWEREREGPGSFCARGAWASEGKGGVGGEGPSKRRKVRWCGRLPVTRDVTSKDI